MGAPQVITLLPSLEHTPDAKYFTYDCGAHRYGVVNGPYRTDAHGRAEFAGVDGVFRSADPLATTISLAPSESAVGLEPGPAAYDARGVWLHGAYVDEDGVLHGYYHAEHPIPTNARPRTPHKSLAYAESRDCGKTWTKPAYPDNRIITGSDPTTDAGDANVVVVGGYLYLFYTESSLSSEPVPAMARSRLADAGRPGTWFKFHCRRGGRCAFNEPGQGGKASAIDGRNLDTFVSYNTYLREYLAIDASIVSNTVEFKVSRDAIRWIRLGNATRLPAPPRGQEYFYPSIISLDGTSAVSSRSFWLYYTQRSASSDVERSLRRVRMRFESSA